MPSFCVHSLSGSVQENAKKQSTHGAFHSHTGQMTTCSSNLCNR